MKLRNQYRPHPPRSSRLAGRPMKVELVEVSCCHCGRKFTPTVTQGSNESRDFFLYVAGTMADMLADGLPLECGECVEREPMDHDPMGSVG